MKKTPVSDDDSEFSAEPQSGAASLSLGAYPDSEAHASMLDSCVLFCDVIIAGKDSAAALKYDEENMFAPMIVILEKDASASSLVQAAGNLGVPVVNNVMLAKNLASYGKVGESIPEASYRDVSLTFARLGLNKYQRPRGFRKNREAASVRKPRPLAVEMGDSLFALTGEAPGREKLLGEPLDAARKKLSRLLGFHVAPIRFSRNSRLRHDEYRLLFKGLEAGRGRLELDWYAGAAAGLSADFFHEGNSGLWSRRQIPDIMNNPAAVRTAAKAAALVVAGHAKEIIESRAHELLGRDEVQAILDTAEEKYPVVTGEVKSLLSLGIIREILMGLVSEQVSIRHMAVILETMADWGSFGTASGELIIEQVRQSLKRQICLEYADDRLTLRVMTLDPKFEKKVMEQFSGSGINADMLPAGEDPVDIICSAAREMEEKGYPPVILCSPRARLTVKEATRRKNPDIAVLSYMEIPPDIRLEPLGEIPPNPPAAAGTTK